MSYDYSENILVQESAGHLLENELGWDVAFAYNTEQLGETGTFGRKSYREILLTRYFREALLRLNPWITPAQMDEAQRTLEHRLSTSSLIQINEEKYVLIREGIPVTVKKTDGKTEPKHAAVIDFNNAENNHFLAIKELKIHGDLYRRRTDIVGFVNGIPLLFVELKKNTVDVQDAYTNNYTDYQDTMWLTGFDVKCLSCLYLDKPLKAHTLMQAIARANRVAEGKSNGLIVDYIGIVKALRKALADYTANANGNGGSDPTVDKDKLIVRILETIAAADAFLDNHGVSLQDLVQARGFEKLALLQTAANAVSATIEEKKTFQTYASELIRLMKYTNRDDVETDVRKRYEAIAAICGELQKKRKTVSE